MNRLPTAPDITPTRLFNPSKDDFVDHLAESETVHHTLVLPSQAITTFPKYIADHIAKHLARKLALDEGGTNPNFEIRYNKWLEEIYVRTD